MWSRRYEMRQQLPVPLVHEQIAMQCAKNIVRKVAALPQPQPRCPSGHLPVLVELRRMDDPTVYYYQVNVPPTGWPPKDDSQDEEQPQQWVLPGTLESLGLRLPQPERPPCPMHGRPILEAFPGSSLEPWTPAPPSPLIMTQCSMHHIFGQNPQRHGLDVASLTDPVMTTEPPDAVRGHFVASLYQQTVSPLNYSDIWVEETPPRSQESAPPRAQPCHTESNEFAANKKPQAVNGVKALPKPPAEKKGRKAELCLDSNNEYVPREQLHRPKINYRSNGVPNGVRREQHYSVQHPSRKPASQQCQQSQQSQQSQVVSPHKGLNGYKDLPGYGYVSKESGKPKNGYKPSDQKMAYSDQDKVRRQMQGQRAVPVQIQGRVAMIEPRVRQEASIEQQVKSSLPNFTDLTESTAASSPIPKELRALFRGNYCALCHTVIRSKQSALDHYASRAHDRRISSWLIRQCLSGSSGTQKRNGDVEAEEALRYLRTARPEDFYCELCDLKLTSLMHARQHFFGRRHRQVASQAARPNGEGYFDAEGKWVRTNAKLLMCELCDVSITSESQMAMHMAGALHRRRVHSVHATRSAGASSVAMGLASFDGSLAPLRPLALQILQARQEARAVNDPSAAFFCETCNITMNHHKSVKQHEQGKMHRRKMHRLPGQQFHHQ
ncbi:uncharacterized protein LOC108100111 [Drosophila ficusphila]|uniref:uncharacterized protein LOC108100111 n=1 Tax=Drosophila ficusphila TaxID=30025 RepID=UPI0007E834C0|nr:uncharacterized protein LOC108100111 [Drosophila ficusphila]